MHPGPVTLAEVAWGSQSRLQYARRIAADWSSPMALMLGWSAQFSFHGKCDSHLCLRTGGLVSNHEAISAIIFLQATVPEECGE